MTQEHVQQVVDFLKENGVPEVKLIRSKHIHVLWQWKGETLKYVLPFTPSDIRGTLNAISDIRRMMGLQKQTKTIGKRRSKRQRPVQPKPVIENNYEDWVAWQKAR